MEALCIGTISFSDEVSKLSDMKMYTFFSFTRERVKRKQKWDEREQIGDDKYPVYLCCFRTQVSRIRVSGRIIQRPDAFYLSAKSRSSTPRSPETINQFLFIINSLV